jgi:deoxycytidylate deaminase
MDTARHFAQFSKDPATKVGAVAVKDNRVVATGWNGFPRWFEDRPEDYADREFKDHHVVHAEKNCVFNSAREGVSLLGTVVYVHGMIVCNKCAGALVQAGVKAVHMAGPPPKEIRQRWLDEFAETRYTFQKCWVDYTISTPRPCGGYEPRSPDEYALGPGILRSGKALQVDV